MPIPIVNLSKRKRNKKKRSHRARNTNNLTPISLSTELNQTSVKMGYINCRSVRNKSISIYTFIIENNFDLLAIVETWLNVEGDESIIQEMLPDGYTYKHVPRLNEARGGGIALIYKTTIQVSLLDSSKSKRYKQFEHMDCLIKCKTHKIRLLIIYRPPPTKQNGLKLSKFWKNWNKLLESFSSSKCDLLLVGDLNFHLDIKDEAETKLFHSSLEEFGLVQLINEPTHVQNHTLDVMIKHEGSNIVSTVNVTDPGLCNTQGKVTNDHFALIAFLNLKKVKIAPKTIKYRNFNSIDINLFSEKLIASNLLNEEYRENISAQMLNNLYDDTLKQILDEVAPVQIKVVYPNRNDAWFNKDILNAKRMKRRAERLWRKTKSIEHNMAFKKLCTTQYKQISTARRTHTSKEIEECGSDQKKLFKKTNKLMGRNLDKNILPARDSDQDLATSFSKFFKNKIKNIQEELQRELPQSGTEEFDVNASNQNGTLLQLAEFTEASCDEVEKLIMQSGNKSCMLDPVPTMLLKRLLPLLIPPITQLINKSLKQGLVPQRMKTAIIRPLIKEFQLDHNQLSNYRPVSNLPFVSKLLEKVVCARIDEYLEHNYLSDINQTAYKKFNSTETALTAVHNDILTNMDNNKATVLVMLDMSAAYDTVNHDIFLNRLSNYFGFSGTVLDWFKSYVRGRKVKVMIADKSSDETELECGVAQGAVLGGKCYNMYTTPLRDIVKTSNEIKRKAYADDNTAWIAFEIGNEEDKILVLHHLTDYLEKISTWMKCNMLKFNQDKTKVIIFSPKKHVNKFCDFSFYLGEWLIKCSTSVKSLGVHLDITLSMQKHINMKTKSAHNQIRNIWTIRKSLTENATKSLVNALAIPKIDYCNSLLFGLKQNLRMKFQRVQNSAARLIKKSKKRQHITPHLKELHWLPVQYRIEFKILLIVFKALHGKAPQYISCLLSNFRITRSDNLKLTIPSVNLVRTGGRAFNFTAPMLWNQLPLMVRQSETVEIFKKNLKTYYFKKHFGD